MKSCRAFAAEEEEEEEEEEEAIAHDEPSRQIEKEEEEEEESGQTADREDVDRQPETQNIDSDGDEEDERKQRIVNRLLSVHSLVESLTGGRQGESNPSNGAGSSSQSATGRNARPCCDDSRSPINRAMHIRT